MADSRRIPLLASGRMPGDIPDGVTSENAEESSSSNDGPLRCEPV